MTDFLSETFSKKTAVKLGLTVVGVAGLTLLAQLEVLSKSSITNSGLAVGPDFDTDADIGGNLNAQEISRAYYGRPLTNAEVAQMANEDQNFSNGELAAGKSNFQKYFAISNADSVISKLGWDLRDHISIHTFPSLLSSVAKVFNPVSWFGGLLNIGHANVLAADGSDTKNYGIVQWGWSDSEENLIKNDPSYQPLNNQLVLEDNSAATEFAIASKFNKCFGYDAPASAADLNASDLTPAADASMGVMLTSTNPVYMQRGDNGDITGGLCAPANLSVDSTDPLAADSSANNVAPPGQTVHKNDLIFRYRLEMNYELTMDQLQGVQNPTANATPVSDTTPTPTTPTPTPGPVTATAQQLAQEILAQAKAGHIIFNVLYSQDTTDGSTPEQNIQETADGKPANTTTTCASAGRGAQPPNATVNLDPTLLQFILDLSMAEDIQINALAGQCHSTTSSNHYLGKAVDFGCPFDAGPADTIGAKYGISDGTGETCGSGAGHYHYSIGGN